ncbi:FIST signal transduction protein [Mucilaginibacter sp. SP1R1]|uniref:FIST signal transduction protein n=1 Tax=Mucilaginibacter sp. SP1R1 TaxID=2723091 RepID=UPI0016142EFC|nr:FIST N-terminal domain-containing protein [Mucilaginibacter sp. SP1R1]MBB6152415.1 hypothetical protein [Mucilaginibacter sp. SP1R1]
MKTKQQYFLNSKWQELPSDLNYNNCQLVFVFGPSACVVEPEIYQYLRKSYPVADIVLSSAAGGVIDDRVYDTSAIVTAVEFEKTKVRCIKTNIRDHKNSFETGNYIMKQLDQSDLKNIFVVSDGTCINGSELVEGFNHSNKQHIPVTGGLAGDDERFEKTFVGLNEIPGQGNVVAIGFYGNDLLIGHSSLGGWDEFGPERTITRSDKNVLYEIDHRNALDLYKEYLGDFVDELPGSALLFPISIKINGLTKSLVRTILNIDEEKKTMIFAGNLPEGSKVRLMKANFNKLIRASSEAATNSFGDKEIYEPDLAILVSCVGRKLVLQERTEEELQGAKRVFGHNTAIAGFYSYGEISPMNIGSQCELHNETMTITTFTELIN